MRRPSFTLVELLVVIVIITTVAGLAMPAATNLMSSFSVTNDQARVLATLSQARALAIRHQIAYSVVFNNFDPDKSWYAIIQHWPPAVADGTANFWSNLDTDNDGDGDGKDFWETAIAKTSPVHQITLTCLNVSVCGGNGYCSCPSQGSVGGATTLGAGDATRDFLDVQVGPRRYFQPGVKWGMYRQNPEDTNHTPGTPRPAANPYWFKVGTSYPYNNDEGLGNNEASILGSPNFEAVVAEGFALNRIKFNAKGQVERIDIPRKAYCSSSNDRLNIQVNANPNTNGSANKWTVTGNLPLYHIPGVLNDNFSCNGPRHCFYNSFAANFHNSNPFLVTWTDYPVSATHLDGVTPGPYVVFSLSRSDPEVRVFKNHFNSDREYEISTSGHIGIGIHVPTGVATAKRFWAPDD